MVRKMIFGPDGSKRGKLSPGYNKWCGDRFDIVKTDTMLREEGCPPAGGKPDREKLKTDRPEDRRTYSKLDTKKYAPSRRDENERIVRLLMDSGFL